jgi:hypothetical protein
MVVAMAGAPTPMLNFLNGVALGDFALKDGWLRSDRSSLRGYRKHSARRDGDRQSEFFHLCDPWLDAPFLGIHNIVNVPQNSNPQKM